jgi:putative FmdB family regulatory protein
LLTLIPSMSGGLDQLITRNNFIWTELLCSRHAPGRFLSLHSSFSLNGIRDTALQRGVLGLDVRSTSEMSALAKDSECRMPGAFAHRPAAGRDHADRKVHRMATYEYRCIQDGVFDVRQPMGTAGPKRRCPTCDGEAVRVFSAPMLSVGSRALVAAIDRTEKTRDEPDVVSALPPRRARTRRPMAARNPALQRLPRP